MALEIAGESPTPLEVLLAERIASLWVLVEAQEAPALSKLQARPRETSRADLRYPDVQDSIERKPPIPRCDEGARAGKEAPGQYPWHPIQYTD
jgi:hypothetical protein